MDKLGEIALQNTVSVKVECQLDEQVVVKNFKIIMECLQQLNAKHDGLVSQLKQHDAQIKDLQHNDNHHNSESKQHSAIDKKQSQQYKDDEDTNNKHKHKLEKLQHKTDKDANEGNAANWDNSNAGQAEDINLKELKELVKGLQVKATKNEAGIQNNLRDVNLLNKEILDIKNEISKMRADGSNKADAAVSQAPTASSGALVSSSIDSMNSEMHKNRNNINILTGQLDKLKELVNDLQEQVLALQEAQANKGDHLDAVGKQGGGKQGASGDWDQQAILNEIRDKLSILQKKTGNLGIVTEDNTNDIKDHADQLERLNQMCDALNQKVQAMEPLPPPKSDDSSDKISELARSVEKLKKQLEELRNNPVHSKTSLEEESGSSRKYMDRNSLTQYKARDDDKLKEIISRLDQLQKMFGSRKLIEEDTNNKDKLPLIRRQKRDASFTEKSSAKRDMAEIKNELMSWLNNHLADEKSKDSLQDIELKIKELKNLVNRKADQEGLRKGLSFLENKIGQLYIFLTEPDGEDAMIVRKGFSCLSCTKKVENLRSKIGPHINWNNMTATNYSPPKVGYSKNMQNSNEDQ